MIEIILWLFSAVFILLVLYTFLEWYDHCDKDEFKEVVILAFVVLLIFASIVGLDWILFNIFKKI